MMAGEITAKGYVPVYKSWLNRVGTLDMINDYDTTLRILGSTYDQLGGDMRSLYHATDDWLSGKKQIHVGESGTLTRFLKFYCWKNGIEKEFVMEGTLKDRKMTDDPSIVGYSQTELMKLDGHTTQWASAAVIAGDKQRMEYAPYKLRLTYSAVKHWEDVRSKNRDWKMRYDPTIIRQTMSFIDMLETGKMGFVPVHSEDYCLARAFDMITPEQGESRWPQLRGHEVDRIAGMEKALKQMKEGLYIDSPDHRIAQAIAMRQTSEGKPVRIKDMSVVNKSWPQFPKMLADFGAVIA